MLEVSRRAPNGTRKKTKHGGFHIPNLMINNPKIFHFVLEEVNKIPFIGNQPPLSRCK